MRTAKSVVKVVNIFIACICRFAFWVWAIPGCKELVGESRTYSWNMNLGAFYILGAYAIQSLIQLDFMYFYVIGVLWVSVGRRTMLQIIFCLSSLLTY